MTITVGSIIDNIELLRPAAGGKAIGEYQQQIILVTNGLVGDTVSLTITAVKPSYLEASIVAIERASPHRTEAHCRHYEQCGGCQLQHSQYEYQLRYKQQVLNDTLQRLGSKTLPAISTLIGASSTRYYRNKLSFSFSNNCWQETMPKARSDYQAGLGFHLANAPEHVLNIDHCYLMSPRANDILDCVRRYASAQQLSYYDTRKNRGLLRSLIIRQNRRGQFMLILEVGYDSDAIGQLLRHAQEQVPELVASYYVINNSRKDSYVDYPLVHVSGSRGLRDTLGDLHVDISPKAFYQTNPEQTEQLYTVVAQYAQLRATDTVYDLYCGTGTIGLWLAHAAKHIVGIEQNPDALADAKHNATLNNIANASFFCGKAELLVEPCFIKANGAPDVVIVDPPRAGLDARLITQLNTLKPTRLIYVSCEPASFARDLKRLSTAFDVQDISAVDMFPHTYHIEAVALLTPRKRNRAQKPLKRRLKY